MGQLFRGREGPIKKIPVPSINTVYKSIKAVLLRVRRAVCAAAIDPSKCRCLHVALTKMLLPPHVPAYHQPPPPPQANISPPPRPKCDLMPSIKPLTEMDFRRAPRSVRPRCDESPWWRPALQEANTQYLSSRFSLIHISSCSGCFFLLCILGLWDSGLTTVAKLVRRRKREYTKCSGFKTMVSRANVKGPPN